MNKLADNNPEQLFNSRHKQTLSCGNITLDLATPKVMGILNVTPDSFSDGGRFIGFDAALLQVEQMIKDGAAIIDIGGESTRPGATEVSVEDELERVIPIIKEINQCFNIIISVDTSKAIVMSEAITHGAGIINDVRALQNDGCLDVAAQANIPVCLMHMQGMPRSMQKNPEYENVITDIIEFFKQRFDLCQRAGIDSDRIILDPGFGFGKTLEQNYQLLAHLSDFNVLNAPILAGISRKSMIGDLLNNDVDQRLAGSLSAAIIAAERGAKIIRVHDVKETVDALTVLHAVNQQY